LQAFRVCQGKRQQFFIAVELICHGAAGDVDSSSLQLVVDLRDAALLLIA
jgi:hypothetical protein